MKIKAAWKYFAYIGKHFPVMCMSGSFPFLPPVADAAKHLDILDDLSQKSIAKHVIKLSKFRSEFEAAEAKADTPQDKATAHALYISVNSAITELDAIRTWEKAPGLYLQVAFSGLHHAATMPSKSERVREKRFLKRLKKLPALLKLAEENIEAVSPSSRATAQTMIRDCARYLTKLGESDLGKVGKTPRFLADAMTALRDFDRQVSARSEIPECEGPTFAEMTTNILGTDKSAQEIYAIAEEEFKRRTESLRFLESTLGTSWQEALEEYNGPAEEDLEAKDVIIREIHRLRGFVFEAGLPGIFSDSALRIGDHPLHMASTLRPIHHEPALGAWPDETSHCYVSPQIFSGRGYRDDPTRLKRMRREFVFMAARQTYPGRHLLDSQRRALGESPLSQIVNPLFTAGWLAFAENLLDELGYLENPKDRLVLHQRGLSRAALAMIDAGLAVGNLDQDKCLQILSDAGFSKEESLNRVRAIRLAPAGRVMPVLGLHELNTLRAQSGLAIGPFCKALFANGQVPFSHLSSLLK